MIVSCPSCLTNFRIAPERLGDDGRTVRCGDCKFEWFQPKEQDADIDDIDDDGEFPKLDPQDVAEVDEEPLPKVYPKNKIDTLTPPSKTAKKTARIMAAILFILCMTGLFLFKETLRSISPLAEAAYYTIGLSENTTLTHNDIALERFNAKYTNGELNITGRLLNLSSGDIFLPTLLLQTDEKTNDLIEFTLPQNTIPAENSIDIDQTFLVEGMPETITLRFSN